MELWSTFINLIQQSIEILTSQLGFSQALAIILVTILARLILMPINTRAMINIYKNKKALAKITPQLDHIKKTYKENPKEMMKRTMALRKKHQIRVLDKTSVTNTASQGLFGFGMFQTLQQMVLNSKFVWIANIAKPDVALAVVVGALTYLSMIVMPGGAEQANVAMFVIPALISFAVLVSFPSAIGLYWATTNLITVAQSIIIKKYFQKQESVIV